ncbi:MAG TPA: TetR/AcrR family transcriptional regulator [Spirochaetales bacterium]|nr:TetR/AcrR family transcriptional regulator [Spirochaetales bacterium]
MNENETLSAFRREREEALYKATIEVLAHTDYRHARIEEIARKADMSNGNIYLYAADKQELVHNAIDWIFRKWLDAVSESDPSNARPTIKDELFAR